ncbi:predicted protein [Pyrenophora tritici-repentis Pt-1C-BFP]|uniref:Uncharacterized protein n=1 Tax=Pyrenophora tritici-repentis (strain Pt-1C-BFP) TaxID=426418 RepID=B2VXS1_PYRTR|nr:uncharacterized protein PTRG_03317 [Pyrenophora tritici-repentis Pt-1C-BFP]EDU45840.1 predicted protein [Pyrenophora tritici-repentis Pt-1C-BFP]
MSGLLGHGTLCSHTSLRTWHWLQPQRVGSGFLDLGSYREDKVSHVASVVCFSFWKVGKDGCAWYMAPVSQ